MNLVTGPGLLAPSLHILLPKPNSICYPNITVRRFFLVIGLLVCGLAAGTTRGDAFKLTTGETVNGELLPSTAGDQGVQIKVGDNQYQRVPWASFSQEDLKTFAKNQKLEPFVEPFIEITREEKLKKTEVTIKQPPRLERPAHRSLLVAMVSSGLGVFMLLVVYAATVYAGYEVAIFRAQPPLLVCGLSAIPLLGFLAPIGFLCLPARLKPGEATTEAPPQPQPSPQAVAAEAVNPMQANGAAHPASLRLAHSDAAEPASSPETGQAKPAQPQVTTFQRGQFTFNRRFFETRFPGFFSVVRREDDRDLVLTIKSARGEYVVQRISRIAADDLHAQIQEGHASAEVMIPFQEIKEIQLKRSGP